MKYQLSMKMKDNENKKSVFISTPGPGEVRWQVNYQNGTYHASSYSGNGYTVELGGYR